MGRLASGEFRNAYDSVIRKQLRLQPDWATWSQRRSGTNHMLPSSIRLRALRPRNLMPKFAISPHNLATQLVVNLECGYAPCYAVVDHFRTGGTGWAAAIQQALAS